MAAARCSDNQDLAVPGSPINNEIADGFGDLGENGSFRASLLQRGNEFLQSEIAHGQRAAGNGQTPGLLRGFFNQSEAHKGEG